MLILDRTQRTWAGLSAIVVALATTLFCWVHYSSPDGARGGTLSGLIFGIIAALMMIYAGLLGARRRLPASWSVGSGGFWMRSHLWIGTLTVPFAAFHAGLSWGGTLEILLWLLFITVIVSGFWGLAMQNILPKMMLENLPRETFIQQIPYLCAQFVNLADKLVSSKCGPLGIDAILESNSEVSDAKPAAVKLPVASQTKATVATNFPGVPTASSNLSSSSDHVAAASTHPHVTAADAAVVPANTKADPQAILAAARARKEQAQIAQGANAAQIAAKVDAPIVSSVAQVTPAATPKSKPDAKAMLEAARLKKERAAAELLNATDAPEGSVAYASEVAPMANTLPPTPAKAKPDPKAMLEAARLKKEQAVAELLKSTNTPEGPVASLPEPAPMAHTLPPTPAKAKPDPKAMLEAARLKKEQAAAELLKSTNTPEGPVASVPEPAPMANTLPPAPAKAKPDPKAMLEAARLKKEQAAAELLKSTNTPEGPVASLPEPAPMAHTLPPTPAKAKPDPKAMLEAARLKKEQAAAELLKSTATPTAGDESVTAIGKVVEVRDPNPAKPKPDAKAILEAARVKKEQARGVDHSAPPTASVPQNVSPLLLTGAAEPAGAGPPIPARKITSPIALTPGIRLAAVSATSKSAVANQQQIGELKLVYLEVVRPYLAPQPITRAWKDSIRRAVLACRIRGAGQHPELIPVFEELRDYCEQRQQFALVEWYHFWMHRWLIFHIPATVALYVILLVHIVMALRVIPFGS